MESLICLDGAIHMNTDESRVKHRGRTVMAGLFLPWTWLGWLGFLGVIVFLASGFTPYPYSLFLFLAAFAVLIGATVAALWQEESRASGWPDRRGDRRFRVLRVLRGASRYLGGWP